MHANSIIHGDCLEIVKQIDSDRFDVIYLDPPFFTQKEHSLSTRNGRKNYKFCDRWASESDYLNFLRYRLEEMRRILKHTGSIFFHCDNNASHLIRNLLDEIFGKEQFRSEIIWSYKRWSNSKKGLLSQHQNIFYYSKTAQYKFNKQFTEYSATTNVDQILQKRERDNRGKAAYARDQEGVILFAAEKKGVPLGDVWEIPFLNPKAQERTGYPTQKPIYLMERIIELASDEGDEVLDPFCGSGTTCIAAKLLNRKYMGIDISQDAISLTEMRLANPIKTDSNLLKKGEGGYRVFDEWVDAHLIGFDCNRIARNSGIDAILRESVDGRIGIIRVQRENELLSAAVKALTKAAKSKGPSKLILVQTKKDLSNRNYPNVLILESPSLQLDNMNHPELEIAS